MSLHKYIIVNAYQCIHYFLNCVMAETFINSFNPEYTMENK